jgi:hypothetical protein
MYNNINIHTPKVLISAQTLGRNSRAPQGILYEFRLVFLAIAPSQFSLMSFPINQPPEPRLRMESFFSFSASVLPSQAR